MEPGIMNLMPGYRMNDYLLVLSPHRELGERIAAIRQEFASVYQTEFKGGGRPYIALASFRQFAMMEERMMNRLRNIAMAHYPFKVELKDFGSFPSHTIFINVGSKLPVQALVKAVRSEAQRLMKPDEDNKPYFMLEPHLNIASRLKPWQYEKGWLEYCHRSFSGRFIADSMALLKKEEESGRFRLASRFVFQNMPVATRQGELFG